MHYCRNTNNNQSFTFNVKSNQIHLVSPPTSKQLKLGIQANIHEKQKKTLRKQTNLQSAENITESILEKGEIVIKKIKNPNIQSVFDGEALLEDDDRQHLPQLLLQPKFTLQNQKVD